MPLLIGLMVPVQKWTLFTSQVWTLNRSSQTLEKQLLNAPSRNKLSSVVDVPFTSVEWNSLEHGTQLLKAGAAETSGVPGNKNKPGLESESCMCQRGGSFVFAWCPVELFLCWMLGQPGACETQEEAGRDAGTAVLWGETAHPLPSHGLSSAAVAGRWHLAAVQA